MDDPIQGSFHNVWWWVLEYFEHVTQKFFKELSKLLTYLATLSELIIITRHQYPPRVPGLSID